MRTSDGSIHDYARSKAIGLGRSLDGKRAIYLDIRFWIFLRDASINPNGFEKASKLLSLLRETVRSGIAFCPISEIVFIELMKQADVEKRKRMAELIDELSLGICLLPNNERIATEVSYFIHSYTVPKTTLHPIRHLVWTKVGYFLGVQHPVPEALDAQSTLAVQRQFLDYMWEIPMTEMLRAMGGNASKMYIDFSPLAASLNTNAAVHVDSLRSFEHVLDEEMRGVADLCSTIAVDVASDIAGKSYVTNSPEHREQCRLATNVLYHALRQNKDVRRCLGSLYVETCLHAHRRWDKASRLVGNDLYDFAHASGALAYCDVFLTENSLRDALTRPYLGLTSLFECKVLSNLEEAVQHIAMMTKRHGAETPNSAAGRADDEVG